MVLNEWGAPAVEALREPPRAALEAADFIKHRLGRRTTTPVRYTFVSNQSDADRATAEDPPMARILRGGAGGEVRLKLELSFLWFAANAPHHLNYPARAWATLLGLDDPTGRGARRVRQATAALSEATLVDITQQPGQPSTVILLDEAGTGDPYVLPGKAFQHVRGSGNEWRHRYVQLPDGLWTQGWITVLSGAAVAMLLVLYVELRGQNAASTDLWFSPDQAVRLYGLSEDTRSKGLRELRAAGLVSARKRSASRNAFDFRRLRNTYRLQVERFGQDAAVPVDTTPPAPMSATDASMLDLFGPPPAAGKGGRGSPRVRP